MGPDAQGPAREHQLFISAQGHVDMFLEPPVVHQFEPKPKIHAGLILGDVLGATIEML
jgi:hypothetical protein